MRARLEDLLGLRALDIYGLSEIIGPGVAAECIVAADGLHVNEDHFLVEAVDPVTGAAGPRRHAGRAGLHHGHQAGPAAAALPDRRHRRRCAAAPARCGRTLARMSKITGRKDDMLVIRGVNVYPSEVERVLLGRGRAGARTTCWWWMSASRSTGCWPAVSMPKRGPRPGRPPS